MTEQLQAQNTPQNEADIEFAELVTQCFVDYIEDLHSRGTTITDAPEAQPLLDICLNTVLPGVKRTSPSVKMFLLFAAGVSYGVEIWRALESAGEEAPA